MNYGSWLKDCEHKTGVVFLGESLSITMEVVNLRWELVCREVVRLGKQEVPRLTKIQLLLNSKYTPYERHFFLIG